MSTHSSDILGLSANEFPVPTEQRIQRGLQNPASPGSLQLGAITKITRARLSWAVSELTALNLEKASHWLDELAKDSPKAALEILLELVKFTTPQQKSMTVEAPAPGGDNLPQMTLAQLQGLVFQRASEVVSEQ